MNRRYLIKSILGLAAAPKILAEMNFEPPITPKPLLTKSLIKDMQLITPQYYKGIVEKYGNENWALTAEQFQSTWNKAQRELFDKLQSNGNENKNI